MILPDVNVLLAAFRADHPQHSLCHGWLAEAANADRRFGLSALVLAAVIRISTNPRIFVEPSRLDEAIDFCDELQTLPQIAIIEPGAGHWSVFSRICREARATGPLVSDAWFAALAIEHGCEWITLDRDFARFPGLRWRFPGR